MSAKNGNPKRDRKPQSDPMTPARRAEIGAAFQALGDICEEEGKAVREGVQEIERALALKHRPAGLLLEAQWELIFPPPSPTQARKLKGESHYPPGFVRMVAALLTAQTEPEWLTDDPEFINAMKTSDAAYFSRLTKAAEYIKQMPRTPSVFASHVVVARSSAARLLLRKGRLPTKPEVKKLVGKRLGNLAYDNEALTRWSDVWKAAELSDLPDGSSARTSILHAYGRKKRPS